MLLSRNQEKLRDNKLKIFIENKNLIFFIILDNIINLFSNRVHKNLIYFFHMKKKDEQFAQ